jgi:hypothetical protein
VPSGILAADGLDDVTAPVTTFASDVSGMVTLSATDDVSGVLKILYSLDMGASWNTYSSSFAAAGKTIEYYAVDVRGNHEDIHTDTVPAVVQKSGGGGGAFIAAASAILNPLVALIPLQPAPEISTQVHADVTTQLSIEKSPTLAHSTATTSTQPASLSDGQSVPVEALVANAGTAGVPLSLKFVMGAVLVGGGLILIRRRFF